MESFTILKLSRLRKIRDLENDTTESNVLISSGPKLEMFMCPLRMNSGLLQICTVMKV